MKRQLAACPIGSAFIIDISETNSKEKSGIEENQIILEKRKTQKENNPPRMTVTIATR